MRGVGGIPKMLSLWRVFEYVKPIMILIEAMSILRERDREVFSCIILGWDICSITAMGLSRCVLSSWNPHSIFLYTDIPIGGLF